MTPLGLGAAPFEHAISNSAPDAPFEHFDSAAPPAKGSVTQIGDGQIQAPAEVAPAVEHSVAAPVEHSVAAPVEHSFTAPVEHSVSNSQNSFSFAKDVDYAGSSVHDSSASSVSGGVTQIGDGQIQAPADVASEAPSGIFNSISKFFHAGPATPHRPHGPPPAPHRPFGPPREYIFALVLAHVTDI